MGWYVTNRDLLNAINDLIAKVAILMTEQEQADALAQQIEADVTAENTALTAIQAEIAALQGANPAVDFTGLNQAVADLGTATAAEQAVVPPAG